MNRFLLVLGLVLSSGCGVSDDAELRDLDEDDWAKLCEDNVSETFTCDLGGGVTYDITFGPEDCTPEDTDGTTYDFPEECGATVGDWRECDEAFRVALRADACTTELPAECAWMNACFSAE